MLGLSVGERISTIIRFDTKPDHDRQTDKTHFDSKYRDIA